MHFSGTTSTVFATLTLRRLAAGALVTIIVTHMLAELYGKFLNNFFYTQEQESRQFPSI